jgi:CRISPR-associated protein Cas2
MEAYGTRVQRSVFECDLSQTMLTVLVYQLKAIIKPRRDRVHVYRCCAACPTLEEVTESSVWKKDANAFIY